MTNNSNLSAKIDALLPQTQCGLCEYPGCKPYAEAIVEKNENIDRCLPGGVKLLKKLGELLKIDSSPFIEGMQEKQKSETMVQIREAECIGCTKCIQVCPVDAIIGASKLMHSVISDICTGCDLCLPACPVDCIDIVSIPERNEIEKNQMASKSRARYEKRNHRLARLASEKKSEYSQAKITTAISENVSERKLAIQEILQRAKEKKKS